jgi:hypothetical protein
LTPIKAPKERFFLAPDGMLMAAGVDTATTLETRAPQPLFQTGITSFQNNHPYDAASNGERFLVSFIDQSDSRITVVLNWPAALKK